MRIALLGDMAFLGSYARIQSQNQINSLGEVSDFLSQFDYVVGNLESPFSQQKKTFGAKSAYICADIDNVRTLRELHVDAVTLANNHMFDFGTEGYELTKRVLDEAGISWFGSEGKELIVEKAGCKVAFDGYCCYSSNPLRCVKKGLFGVNAYNLNDAKCFIQRCNSNGFLPIIAVHAGIEHVNYPSIDHIRAARQLSMSGPFVYYGHHPHVIQGTEEYNGSLISHSLGNFCFDDVYSDISLHPLVELTDNNRTGAVLELEIEGNKLKSWKLQTIYISKEGILRLIEEPATIAEFNESLKKSEANSKAYTAMRNQIISSRMNERKSARNFIWYLKRFRPRYLKIIMNARNNAKAFDNNVLRYMKK